MMKLTYQIFLKSAALVHNYRKICSEEISYSSFYYLQQSPEYPNYQYLCKLCSVHIENIQGAHKHIKEKRHKKNITV